MDDLTFKHFLQELIDSATTGDVQKLLVQAGYFEEMSLSQQMEAGSAARTHISPTLFLNVYRLVIEKNILSRRNAVLRKILKDTFLSDHEILREAIAMVPVTDSVSIQFMESCLADSNNKELSDIFHAKLRHNSVETVQRTEDVAQIQNYCANGSDESVQRIMASAGNDIGLDILAITKLAPLHTEAAWRGIVQFLGMPSTKVRGFASAKLEEGGALCVDVLLDELANAVSNPYPDKAICILTVLKVIAKKDHVKQLRKISRHMPNHINMQVALLDTLVKLDPEGTAPLLVDHLCNGVDDISYFAASMLNAHSSDRIITGIQNMIESKIVSIARLVEVIVFSQADKLAASLSVDKAFFDELYRLCGMAGMGKYARIFGIPDSNSTESITNSSIWAIDDSRMILRMYDRFAVEAGVTLKTFESGETLKKSLNEPKPSLIFVDLNMPEMNGIEVAIMLRENGWGDIPCVLVTTQSDIKNGEQIQNGLFTEIVQKPFTPDMLTIVANKYL